MSEQKPPFWKRKYLLNPRFQLKYTLVFLVLAALVAGVLGWLLYSTVRENSQLIRMDNPEANDAIQALLTQQDLQVLYRIFGLLGGMVFAITVLGIMVTHQIAGPAMLLTRHLRTFSEGKLPKLRALRPNDELGDLFLALDIVITNTRNELTRDIELLTALKATAPAQAAAIDEAIARKKKTLEA